MASIKEVFDLYNRPPPNILFFAFTGGESFLFEFHKHFSLYLGLLLRILWLSMAYLKTKISNHNSHCISPINFPLGYF